MRGTPREMGPAERADVGTLHGQWVGIMAYLGRPAMAAAGYYLEFRFGISAPAGWSSPVIGVDGDGLPAAVRSALPEAPPEDPDPGELAAALADLAARIDGERKARIAEVGGDAEEQTWRVSRMLQIQAAIQAATATDADRLELAALLEYAARIEALRQYGRTSMVPPMWGTAGDPAATLYGWAVASQTDPAAVAAIDPAYPPAAAPQWPAP
jgi:hypothetical protein